MQNIDFYNGQGTRRSIPQFDNTSPEFYSRNTTHSDDEASRKKAIRILFVIIALCIVSFTTGLALGIKFAGGPDKEIIDKKTYKTMSTIGNKMTHYIKGVKKKSFPKDKYPFVIKIGNQYSKARSLDIAKFLSAKNHTVVISKGTSGMYKVYLPYRDIDDAKSDIVQIKKYQKYQIGSKIKLRKR